VFSIIYKPTPVLFRKYKGVFLFFTVEKRHKRHYNLDG